MYIYTVMPAITTNTTTEEQLASLSKAIEGLTAIIHNQEWRLNDLTNKVRNMMEGEGSRAPTRHQDAQNGQGDVPLRIKIDVRPGLVFKEAISHHQATEKSILVTGGMIPVNQLNNYIMEAIRGKLEGGQPSYTYAKPYTQWIEELRIPFGYQSPKF